MRETERDRKWNSAIGNGIHCPCFGKFLFFKCTIEPHSNLMFTYSIFALFAQRARFRINELILNEVKRFIAPGTKLKWILWTFLVVSRTRIYSMQRVICRFFPCFTQCLCQNFDMIMQAMNAYSLNKQLEKWTQNITAYWILATEKNMQQTNEWIFRRNLGTNPQAAHFQRCFPSGELCGNAVYSTIHSSSLFHFLVVLMQIKYWN